MPTFSQKYFTKIYVQFTLFRLNILLKRLSIPGHNNKLVKREIRKLVDFIATHVSQLRQNIAFTQYLIFMVCTYSDIHIKSSRINVIERTRVSYLFYWRHLLSVFIDIECMVIPRVILLEIYEKSPPTFSHFDENPI